MPLQTYFSFQRYRERGTALRRSSLSSFPKTHNVSRNSIRCAGGNDTQALPHAEYPEVLQKAWGEEEADKEEGGGTLQASQATNTRNIPPNSMPTSAHWQQSTQCSRTRRLVCACQRYTLKVSAVRLMIQENNLGIRKLYIF